MTLIHTGDRITLSSPDGPRREGYVTGVRSFDDRTVVTLRLDGASPALLTIHKGTTRPDRGSSLRCKEISF